MEKITIKDFLENLKDRLGLVLIAGESGLKNTLETKYLNRPSMALMGWYKVFAYHRIQVFGKTELTYLKSLGVQFEEDQYFSNHLIDLKLPEEINTKRKQ